MENTVETPHIAVVTATPITKESVSNLMFGLFNDLEDAIGDTATAVAVFEQVRQGLQADPEFSKKVLTPENISRAFALKTKSDAGTLTLVDFEQAFPDVIAQIPFWSVVKMFVGPGVK